MNVLVSAASKHGATAEIAAWVAEELGRNGVHAVVVQPRTEVESWARGIAERLTSTVATPPVPTAV